MCIGPRFVRSRRCVFWPRSCEEEAERKYLYNLQNNEYTALAFERVERNCRKVRPELCPVDGMDFMTRPMLK